jgi:hypothetical protein
VFQGGPVPRMALRDTEPNQPGPSFPNWLVEKPTDESDVPRRAARHRPESPCTGEDAALGLTSRGEKAQAGHRSGYARGTSPNGYLKMIKGTAEEASGLRSDPALGFDAAGGEEDLFATKVDHSVILVPQVLGAAIGVPTSGVAAFVFH